MKFKEMKYERPDMDEVVKEIAANTEKLKNAKTYEEAKRVFLEEDAFEYFNIEKNQKSPYMLLTLDVSDKII